MRNVSVSDLKSRLSHYLREVRRGGEVQVLDRGIPVARLTAVQPTSELTKERHRERLLQAGLLRAGKGTAAELLNTQPLKLPISISEALIDEREDRF